MNTPSQSQRNARWASGAHGDDSRVAATGAEVLAAAGSPACSCWLISPPTSLLTWSRPAELKIQAVSPPATATDLPAAGVVFVVSNVTTQSCLWPILTLTETFGDGGGRHDVFGGAFECCGPAGEQVEPVLGGRTRLCGVHDNCQPRIRGKVHRLEGQVKISNDWVMNVLQPSAVEAHIVRLPSGSELVAPQGQLNQPDRKARGRTGCGRPQPSR